MKFRFRSHIFLIAVFCVLATTLVAEDTKVLATTPWSGAFALIAGVEDVEVLAPFDLQHPPDYELKPSDIKLVMNADLLIYAGYEVMMPKLHAALGKDAEELLQIVTTYSWADVQSSVMKIAAAAGTAGVARENLEVLEAQYDEWKIHLNAEGLLGKPVIAHFFQRPLVEELGFTVVGVFGPAPLEPKQISELAKTGTTLIIDNKHNPMGKPLEEVIENSERIQWINFPGMGGTRTLSDVLMYNRKQMEMLE